MKIEIKSCNECGLIQDSIAKECAYCQSTDFELLPPKEYEGNQEGETCNREGCAGVIEKIEQEPCSCHISPPCHSCCQNYEYCPECGWEPEQP